MLPFSIFDCAKRVESAFYEQLIFSGTVKVFPSFKVAINSDSDNVNCNLAIHLTSAESILLVENYMRSIKRKPCVYVSAYSYDMADLTQQVLNRGYKVYDRVFCYLAKTPAAVSVPLKVDVSPSFEDYIKSYLLSWSVNENGTEDLASIRGQKSYVLNTYFSGNPSAKTFLFRDENNRVFGTAALLVGSNEAAYIGNIAVEPSFRKKGYARKILKFLENYAIEKNISALGLIGFEGSAAYDLYVSEGFSLGYKVNMYYLDK